MARKKIREYDSKRLVKEHFKRLSGKELPIKSAQVTGSTDFSELQDKEPWLSSSKLVVKPDMLFGKRGKSGLVALNLDFAQVASFVKERLGKEVEMGGCKGPITTFIVEPFIPHNEEFYLNIVSERLGNSISFSECGGIDIEENWDKVKTVFIPTGVSLTSEIVAPLVATLPLEIKGEIEEFLKVIFTLFQDLDFTFLEMNPFTLVDGKPCPLDMRGELDDTAAFKNFKKWGNIEFPLPFGRVMSATESFVHELDEKVLKYNFDLVPNSVKTMRMRWMCCACTYHAVSFLLFTKDYYYNYLAPSNEPVIISNPLQEYWISKNAIGLKPLFLLMTM